MRKFVAAALLAACSATPAFAQDASDNFNGPWIGVVTGYDSVELAGDSSGGIMYGVGVGYDFRLENVVLGIEAEATESTAGECGGGVCVDASRDLYIGGRIGVVATPNLLVYAKAGYSNARVEVETGGTTIGGNGDGVRVGGGVEYQFANSPVSVRAEYRYSDYEGGFSRHQGVLGLNYRF